MPLCMTTVFAAQLTLMRTIVTEIPGSKSNTKATDGLTNDSTKPFGIHLLDVGMYRF